MACTSVDAVLAWLLGYSELSLERIDIVHRLVDRLENPHSISFGLAFSAIAGQLRRDLKATIQDAETLIDICLERDVHWTPFGGILKGWALAQSDPRPEHLDSIRQGVEDWMSTGNMLVVPYLCALQAETQAKLGEIDDALSTLEHAMSQAEENQERWFDAEFYRLKADFLLQQAGKPVQEAENCYQRSLEIARAQNAHALELRTAHGLALLWIEQGRTEEVQPLLQPIMTRFDADVDSHELEQVRRLAGASR